MFLNMFETNCINMRAAYPPVPPQNVRGQILKTNAKLNQPILVILVFQKPMLFDV